MKLLARSDVYCSDKATEMLTGQGVKFCDFASIWNRQN
jgi:hypothetical protein